MSSSGLIYAVIVGAWAAYLVPMWLRRQDELNEARPTERFSTAIRLLSGKAAMERRYAKDAERRDMDTTGVPGDSEASATPDSDEAHQSAPDGAPAREIVDVRSFADPTTMVGPAEPEAGQEARGEAREYPRSAPAEAPKEHAHAHAHADAEEAQPRSSDRAQARGQGEQSQRDRSRAAPARAPQRSQAASARSKRAKVLARRRRTTMLLFLTFTAGSIVAAVGGIAFLWAPAVPAALLSAYIGHLRVQERRRFTFTMDKQRAEAAARQLHERRTQHLPAEPATAAEDTGADTGPEPDHEQDVPAQHEPRHTPAARRERPGAADRRALVEQTDHAEWVDQQRGNDRDQSDTDGWDPVPVPLPTYVSAPVAPRTTREVDLEAPNTWSSARSSTVGGPQPRQRGEQTPAPGEQRHGEPPAAQETTTPQPRRAREHGRTPLFDQYEDEERPRAANE